MEAKKIYELFINEMIEEKEAVIVKDQIFLYRDLQYKIQVIENALKDVGVKEHEIIACSVNRNIDLIATIFAIFKLNCVYLPIDVALPKERKEYMLEDSGARYLLHSAKMNEEDDSIGQEIYGHLGIMKIKKNSYYSMEDTEELKDVAYLMYTSGTTGRPKGVLVKVNSLLTFIKGIEETIHLKNHKVILAATTISFDISILELVLPLVAGITIVIATEDEQKDPSQLAKLIIKYNVDIIQMTPTRINTFFFADKNAHTLRNLKSILVGGENFPDVLLDKIKSVTSANIFNMYGPTETTIWSSIKQVNREITIGNPVLDTDIFLYSDGNIIKEGIGEICIEGEGVSKGYWRRKELTNEKFKRVQGRKGTVYFTGDLGRYNSNDEIICLGRNDSQVKVNGHRIELLEIENVILKNSRIKEAVVLKKEKGMREWLSAYLVTSDHLTLEKINLFIGQYLPDYMLLNELFILDELPVNSNGKVDRKALTCVTTNLQEETIPAYSTDVEKELAIIWKSVLNFYPEPDTTFFDCGGTSIDIANIISLINEKFNKNLLAISMFEYPTIKDMARLLEH